MTIKTYRVKPRNSNILPYAVHFPRREDPKGQLEFKRLMEQKGYRTYIDHDPAKDGYGLTCIEISDDDQSIQLFDGDWLVVEQFGRLLAYDPTEKETELDLSEVQPYEHPTSDRRF